MRKKTNQGVIKRMLSLFLAVTLAGLSTACAGWEYTGAGVGSAEAAEAAEPVEKNGEVYVLYTSDVHCGIDQGFGYVGLKQIRDGLEAKGYETILVDDGDAMQGEAVGLLSRGEAIVGLMNEAGYDVAIPGNHDFDYGMERFLELKEEADYPYISCNLTYEGEPILAPYVIHEAAGMKIAFVGVTTPESLVSSKPTNFQNEEGETVYGFLEDATGEALYAAVQEAVDAARAEGADLVYLLGHLGMEEACKPWTYADVLSHTSGIDVMFDGHSHDMEQVVMNNKDGEPVVRSACGTKFQAIGYSRITADKQVAETDIWRWNNDVSVTELLGVHNEMTEQVAAAESKLQEMLGEVVAHTDFPLTIHDPEATDEKGNPIRMVRRAETNLADFLTDLYREYTGADIVLMGGGSVRVSVGKGDITYGDILKIQPFNNDVVVVEVTGQRILDALEWGARSVPDEFGGFLQASGLSYEIDASIDSPVQSEEGRMTGIQGPRRVSNVLVGEEPIDPEKTYTVAGQDFLLVYCGDGHTAFEGAGIVQESVGVDSQVLIDGIREIYDGVVPAMYADPYGVGRIVITE